MEPDNVRILFMMFIAIMDEDGFVNLASEKNVAHRAIMDLEDTKKALKVLESPDPDSSNPANEGRRIERVPGGWVVLNANEYRGLAKREHQKELNRKRVQKHRSKNGCNAPVMEGNEPVTPSEAEAEANTDTKTDTKTEKKPPKSPKGTSLPLPHGPRFKEAWENWVKHRSEIRKKLTPTSTKAQLKKLGEMPEARAVAMIEHTISNGWQGLREPEPPKGQGNPQQVARANPRQKRKIDWSKEP